MKKIALALPAILLLLTLGFVPAASAQGYPPGYDGPSGQAAPLTAEELDDLLAPIALYPDPLIAQILPAATFVDQIDEAARYVRQFGKSARIDAQPWDLSVKAVAHYPDVLFMMDQKYDWTVSLGQAFIEQPQDVMDAIQRLRADAQAQGNLYSTQQQQVIDDPAGIMIVPASPEYVYVPVYDPQLVYEEPYAPDYPFITFGVGFAIGAWLDRDCDWRRHRVFYHGWRGGGWIGRARPHIHDRGGIYIGKNAAVINTSKKVLQHDTRRYRQQLRNNGLQRHEGRGLPAAPPLNKARPGRIERQKSPAGGQQRAPESGRQREPEAGGKRPAATGQQSRPATGQKAAPAAQQKPASATVQQHVPTTARQPVTVARPSAGDVYRGRDVQRVQPASRSGYGGYGSGNEATIYHQRGQASQQSMRPLSRPAPTPRVAPAAAPARQMERPAASAPPAPRPVAPQSGAPGRERH